MKNRYRLISRGSRGGALYCVDGSTGKRTSLGECSRDEAQQIVLAKNQALRQPALNLQIARAYLGGSDEGVATRTWQHVMDEMPKFKTGETQARWLTAIKDKAFYPLRRLCLLETKADHILRALEEGTVSTNVYLRRLHNFAVDIRQLEVRPDKAPPGWEPRYTMNILADRSIPFSTYAKILVDVATAAGQKGGQAFFKNAAQIAIQNALGTLDALDLPVTIDNCYYLVTDMAEMEKRVGELVEIAKPEHRHLLDYYREFVKQPPEQLGGIRSTVFNYLQPYTTPDLAEVFCSADPTFDIKEIDEGRLITIKIPQKYQVEKKYISLLLKVQFYLHALRRYDLPAEQRDQKNLIVLVLDEAQETVLVSEDGISDYNVVDKIRGARATTINSTQSPTSYIPPMGSREKADVFLLNLGNKIYFTAADKQASDMIADSIGKHTIKKRTYGRSLGNS